MTETAKKLFAQARLQAEARREKTRKFLRRNRLVYVGIHGVAFERAQERVSQYRTARTEFFDSLVEKGEELETQAVNMFKGVKHKAEDIAEDASEAVWKFTPGAAVNRVEALEAELAAAKAKFEKLGKKAKSKAKKTADKAGKPEKTAAVKTKAAVAKTSNSVKDAAKAEPKTKPATTTNTKPATKTTAKQETTEARHIPYFNDVKRYDPLASEDVVRKIVNHCGIALRSEDARYVACTDEAERNRVRDSWIKKKLEITGTDADLDKKVENVCSIMQRDNRKNRVTFYYLVAKAERKLGAL